MSHICSRAQIPILDDPVSVVTSPTAGGTSLAFSGKTVAGLIAPHVCTLNVCVVLSSLRAGVRFGSNASSIVVRLVPPSDSAALFASAPDAVLNCGGTLALTTGVVRSNGATGQNITCSSPAGYGGFNMSAKVVVRRITSRVCIEM